MSFSAMVSKTRLKSIGAAGSPCGKLRVRVTSALVVCESSLNTLVMRRHSLNQTWISTLCMPLLLAASANAACEA